MLRECMRRVVWAWSDENDFGWQFVKFDLSNIFTKDSSDQNGVSLYHSTTDALHDNKHASFSEVPTGFIYHLLLVRGVINFHLNVKPKR